MRSGGWLWRFEDWMLEVAAAQDLEETLSDAKASVGDLISLKEFESIASITFEFGESTIKPQDIADMAEVGFFMEGRVKLLLRDKQCLRLRRSMPWCSWISSPADSGFLRMLSSAK